MLVEPSAFSSAPLLWLTPMHRSEGCQAKTQDLASDRTNTGSSEVGDAVSRSPSRLGDGFLGEEARSGNHREARVRELLLLHELELRRVSGREVERVECEPM